MDTTSPNGTELLQARLSQPQVAEALARILDRLDTLEKAIDALADAVVQLPRVTALAADSVDETVRRLQEEGIDPEERLREGLAILEKATRPENVRVLSALLDRMDRVEQALELADQAPQLAALAADSVDETVRRLQEEGIDPEERLREGLAVLEKATRPENVRVLSALLDRMDRVAPLVELMDRGPELMAMAVDSLDEAYMEIQEAGVDPETLVREGLRAAAKLNQLMTSPEYEALLESGLLDPGTLRAVAALGEALAEAQSQPPPRLGPWGLLRALGDAHVQRATGFLVNVARAFGARLG